MPPSLPFPSLPFPSAGEEDGADAGGVQEPPGRNEGDAGRLQGLRRRPERPRQPSGVPERAQEAGLHRLGG